MPFFVAGREKGRRLCEDDLTSLGFDLCPLSDDTQRPRCGVFDLLNSRMYCRSHNSAVSNVYDIGKFNVVKTSG